MEEVVKPLLPKNRNDSVTYEITPPPQVVIPSTVPDIVEEYGHAADLETNSSSSCRICLESGADHGDELISPCMCKGTQQFVHRSCLDHWRSVKEGFAFSHCTTCKAQYHLRIALFETSSWRTLKFRLFVARDLLLGFLAVQTVIAAMGAFAYFVDKNGDFRNSFGDGWDAILSKHPIPFYYCIGVVIFFVMLGICGFVCQCLLCCGRTPDYDPSIPCCEGYFLYSNPCSPTCDCCEDSCLRGLADCCRTRGSRRGYFTNTGSGGDMQGCAVLLIVVVVIFVLLGIVYGFIVASLGVQHVWQRHYHILTKRELTKEYIVEDLHGCYTAPNLDQQQEDRLRTLKLL